MISMAGIRALWSGVASVSSACEVPDRAATAISISSDVMRQSIAHTAANAAFRASVQRRLSASPTKLA